MAKPTEITDDFLALFDAVPGESLDLAIRKFETDMEAHDSELQEQYWAEMSANFSDAISLATARHGPPDARLKWDDPSYDEWLEHIPISFFELAAWKRDDRHHLYVLLHHEDRELPILVMAGVTD